MLEAYLMRLQLWLYMHYQLHGHMYSLISMSKHKDKRALEQAEMREAETSAWKTYRFITSFLNQHMTETLTPPTA